MTKILRSVMVATAACSFAFAATENADTQACIGSPTANGQMAFAFTVHFPMGGNTFGGEFNDDFPGPASVFVGVSSFNPEVEDAVTSVGGGAAFDLAPLTAALPAVSPPAPRLVSA
jgi:hypothetical protein